MPKVFAYFRDSKHRRDAFSEKISGEDDSESSLFSGLFELEARGWEVDLNLRRHPGTIAHHLGTWISAYLHRHGGYGGDFASCLKMLRQSNRADVVWSTVDTVGIPLSIFKALGLLRPPLVYTSIGLVERFRDLPESAGKKRQLKALGKCAAFIGYGYEETEVLRQWFPGVPVYFVPYGVNTEIWKPLDRPKRIDVLSLGMDWQRDFNCLIPFAKKNPGRKIKIITSQHLQKQLQDIPENIQLCDPVPLSQIPEEMAAAHVIALPVKQNTYSGATTTLLQAMSMGLPVAVSEVGAIKDGYDFRQHQSCIPVPPENPDAWTDVLQDLLASPEDQKRLATRAQAHVDKDFAWPRFVSRVEQKLLSATLNPPHSNELNPQSHLRPSQL